MFEVGFEPGTLEFPTYVTNYLFYYFFFQCLLYFFMYSILFLSYNKT